MNAHNYNFPSVAQIDQAAAAFRHMGPILASLYKGLIANGLERDEAASVVVGYIMYPPPEEDE